MRTAVAIVLACCSLATPAIAGQRRAAFHVGAVVRRSCTVHASPGHVSLVAGRAVLVAIDGAPPRLVRGDVTLPPGTVRVSIQY